MKRAFLVYGDSGMGKTTLCESLKEKGFSVLPVDTLYVDFIKELYPSLYFNNLNMYVAQHYLRIFATPYTAEIFGKDILSEWVNVLYGAILSMVGESDSVAIEGYLLRDYLTDLFYNLYEMCKVVSVRVSNHKYYIFDAECDVDTVAGYGLDTKGTDDENMRD